MEAKDKKLKEGNYSPSELNNIRAKSVDSIRKIREEILSQNVNNSNPPENKGLQTP